MIDGRNKIVTKIATSIYRVIFPYILATISVPVYYMKYRKHYALKVVEAGFSDHSKIEPLCSDEVLDRLLSAYHIAKHDQRVVKSIYKPGRYWQELLDARFGKLTQAIQTGNKIKIRRVLENFNREECSYDTCGGGYFYDRMKHIPLYKYQFANNWIQRYEMCNKVTGALQEYDLPFIGNPVGLYHQNSVVPLCSLEYRCYAKEIKELLKDIESPTICEIGGGVGGQAYEVISGIANINYIMFDIPEALLVSSYYLMMAFPKSKFKLYGESKGDKTEISLLPNYMMPEVSDDSIDMVFNSCSFSEMDYSAVEEYINQIDRVCNGFLMHINHDARLIWYENNHKITNMISSEVIPKTFELIYKKPRPFLLLEDSFVIKWFFKARYYQYLYKKRLKS